MPFITATAFKHAKILQSKMIMRNLGFDNTASCPVEAMPRVKRKSKRGSNRKVNRVRQLDQSVMEMFYL